MSFALLFCPYSGGELYIRVGAANWRIIHDANCERFATLVRPLEVVLAELYPDRRDDIKKGMINKTKSPELTADRSAPEPGECHVLINYTDAGPCGVVVCAGGKPPKTLHRSQPFSVPACFK